MKLFSIALCMAVVLSSYAQIIVGETDINTKEDISIITVELRIGMSKGYKAHVDYGQPFSGPKRLPTKVMDSKTGKAMKFNSIGHVLNYFQSNGWAYIESVNITGDKLMYQRPVILYTFRKK